MKKYGITQKELSEKMGINRVSLNTTLNNPNIKLSTIERIASAIGCSVGEFFISEQEKPSSLTCPKCGAELEIDIKVRQ